jgi:outer membrane phospholipase A
MLMTSAVASAGGIDTVLTPPKGFPRSGQAAEFSVYILNPGGETVSVHIPARLACRVVAGDLTVEATATATDRTQDESVTLAAGGFVKRRYVFTVPKDLDGPVRLDVREFAATGIMFRVRAGQPTRSPATAAETPKSAETAPPQEEFVTLDSLLTRHQPYLLNFSAYEPMYFLVGTDPEKSKFQISFKYRLLNPKGPLVEEYPWMRGLHLGFTQTSFWDLKSSSAPFEDTSYKPELFFTSPNVKNRPSWMHGLFLQTGLKHESNGRDGPESRSANFFYAKPVFVFYSPKIRYGLAIAPKVWTYILEGRSENPDLRAYRGYFELELKLGKEDGFILGSSFRWASAGASLQLDLTYPIHRFLFGNIDLYLHAQYVNALAESMLHYRERTEAVRLGFSIVR